MTCVSSKLHTKLSTRFCGISLLKRETFKMHLKYEDQSMREIYRWFSSSQTCHVSQRYKG